MVNLILLGRIFFTLDKAKTALDAGCFSKQSFLKIRRFVNNR